MNGRIYDPLLGKFLSADPLVQDPINGQSYNRYSYVLNNPTNLTDPTGFAACEASTGSRLCNEEQKSTADWGKGFNALGVQDKAKVIASAGISVVNAVLSAGGFNKVDAKNLGAAAAKDLFGKVDGETHKLLTASINPYIPTDSNGQENRLASLTAAGKQYGDSAAALGQEVDRFGQTMSFITMQSGLTLTAMGENGIGLRLIGGLAVSMAGQDGGSGGGNPLAAKGTTSLRNGHLAGGVHPKTGIPFDKAGHPDFSGVAKAEVKIAQTGSRAGDFRAANEAAGFRKTPEGYTWHHHQDRTTMQLVPRDIHAQTGHTGGFQLRP